jgi:hypothetical protein
VVWQLRGTVSEERESRALRLIAVIFFFLAAYLAIESIIDLARACPVDLDGSFRLDFLMDEERLKRHDLTDAEWARLEPQGS